MAAREEAEEAIEAAAQRVVRRVRAEVPLAHVARRVARALEQLAERLLVVRQAGERRERVEGGQPAEAEAVLVAAG